MLHSYQEMVSFCSSVVLLLLSCVTLVTCYSSGAPTSQCTGLTPNHPGSPGTNPGGFYIYSDLLDCNGNYNASQAYTSKRRQNPDYWNYSFLYVVRLEGSKQFRGLIIQARQSGSSTLIGTFSNLPSGTQFMACGGSSTVSTLYHVATVYTYYHRSLTTVVA